MNQRKERRRGYPSGHPYGGRIPRSPSYGGGFPRAPSVHGVAWHAGSGHTVDRTRYSRGVALRRWLRHLSRSEG